jgi:hypothetical protein
LIYLPAQSIKHGQHVFRRRIALDVVDCGEDESVLLIEYSQSFCHLLPDFVGSTEG